MERKELIENMEILLEQLEIGCARACNTEFGKDNNITYAEYKLLFNLKEQVRNITLVSKLIKKLDDTPF